MVVRLDPSQFRRNLLALPAVFPPLALPSMVRISLLALAYSLLGAWTHALPIVFTLGFALAVLLLWDSVGLWPWIWGELALQLWLGQGVAQALLMALGAGLALVLTQKALTFCQFSPQLARLRDVILLILLGAFFPSLLKACFDHGLWNLGQGDWLSYSSGSLLLTPLLLRFGLAGRGLWRRRHRRQRLLEALLCFSFLAVLGWLIFASQHWRLNPWDEGLRHAQSLEYLPFPFVVWAALRFPTWGAVGSTLVISALAIVGTLQGEGSFIVQSQDFGQAVIVLQIFIIILTSTTLLLSAAVAERQRMENQLRLTWERDRLIAETAQKVRQSLDLSHIFQTTVTEIRRLLHTDRVYIALLNTHHRFEVVAESLAPGYPSLRQGQRENPRYEDIVSLLPKSTWMVHNVEHLTISSTLANYYRHYQIKGLLTVPLVAQGVTLGLLVAHHCHGPRHWHRGDIRLMEQLGTQVAIAIQQAQLYQKVQALNQNLEEQVKARTAELEEKMLELADLNQMKAIFLQAVSHDLRTSLMGLVMLLKNLQNRSDETLVLSRPVLDCLVQSGERQLTLLNALAEHHFATPQALVLNCQALALPTLIDQLNQDWSALFQQNQIQFQSDVTEPLPLVWADGTYLRQVLDNLLTNALKHNPPDIELHLSAVLEQKYVRLMLQDTGIGMDVNQCRQLFRPYLRSVHNQRLTGIGLGCYQCRQIIEAHGGQIGVESQPGQGTTFWFTLPLAE
ncbi:ATP-binding protein [Synechocystis sp. LKSZ1]|uniref:ATP-binding protein n=1 Tax=Synechocystis sp. LKSZ1 TaxID=3144951 RepID=UPI00336C10E0